MLQATILEDVVSPAASFRSQRSVRSMVPGTEAAPQDVAMSGTKSQADSESRSRSESQEEEETEGAASPAGVIAAAEESNLSDEAGHGPSNEAAAEQTFGWGVATRESELDSLGMTGRSASSKSTTRRRKVRTYGIHCSAAGCKSLSDSASQQCWQSCFTHKCCLKVNTYVCMHTNKAYMAVLQWQPAPDRSKLHPCSRNGDQVLIYGHCLDT